MRKAAIFLSHGFEEIEGLTVVDLLRRAEVDIQMVSIEESLNITGAHQITCIADKKFEELDFDEIDMIILPGGMPGTTHLQNHKKLGQKIVEFSNQNKKLAAICAAPTVYAKYGLLKGKKATCYPGQINNLTDARYVEESVVVDGNVITSRGMGTAIEFSLKLIEIFKGKETAEKIKDQIIYEH